MALRYLLSELTTQAKPRHEDAETELVEKLQAAIEEQ